MVAEHDRATEGGMVARRIRQALEHGLSPVHLDVIDESHKHASHAHVLQRPGGASGTQETHFRIKIVTDRFAGKSRIDRHREINALLGDEMGPDKVHALAIDARAPGE